MKRTLLSLVIGVSMTTGALADDLMQVYQQALANDPLVNQAKAQRDAAFEGISIRLWFAGTNVTLRPRKLARAGSR